MRNLIDFFYKHQDLLIRLTTEVIGKASALILALLLARTLGTSGYAAMGNANLITAASLPLLSLGFGFTLVRITAGLTKGLPVAKRYYSSLCIAGTACLVFVSMFWIFSESITHQLFDDATWLNFVKLIAVFSIASVVELLTVETLRARQLIIFASSLQIISSLSSLLLCLILFWLDNLSPISALTTLIIIRIATAVASHILLIITNQITLAPFCCDSQDTKRAVASGLPFAASGFGTWLIEHGDRFILTASMEQNDFGRYLAALAILSVVSVCGAPFWYLLFPKLAQAHSQKDFQKFATSGRYAITGFIITIIPISIFVILALPNLLPALAGPEYHIDSKTSTLLVVSLLIIQSGSPWEYACIVAGKSKSYLVRTLSFGVLGLILGWVFIPYLGITGAALSALITRLSLGVSLYYLASKSGHGKALLPEKQSVLTAIGAGIPTALFCFFILEQEFIKQDSVLNAITAYGAAFIPICIIYFTCFLLFSKIIISIQQKN